VCCLSLTCTSQGCEEMVAHLAQTYKKYWLYRKDDLASRRQQA
jgi:hypothetical protein